MRDGTRVDVRSLVSRLALPLEEDRLRALALGDVSTAESEPSVTHGVNIHLPPAIPMLLAHQTADRDALSHNANELVLDRGGEAGREGLPESFSDRGFARDSVRQLGG